MATDTKIEWTHPPGFRGATWNPTRGCRKLSAGCKHCYAETFAERWRGIPGHAYERGFDPRTVPESLDLPLRTKAPTCWFVNSMSDLFLDDFDDEFIAAVFGVMAAAPQHTFLVLTKRAERMRRWSRWLTDFDTVLPFKETRTCILATSKALRERFAPYLKPGCDEVGWPLPNVWLGVSVEDQATADERIPHLLATPAAVWFVSYEPALGPVDFESIEWPDKGGHRVDVLRRGYWNEEGYLGLGPSAALGAKRGGFTNHSDMNGIDWLIVGGESGPGARECRQSWLESAVAQCREARVPVFVKQMGANACDDVTWRGSTPDYRFRDRKGGDPAEWPEDLRVREWPRGAA